MSSVYDKAIKFLKIRPHHSEELRKKLRLRGFPVSEIDSVIQKLHDENLIDNDQFAQMYLDELLRYKTFGFYGLKYKLMQRGIASKEAEQLLKAKLSIADELEIAKKVSAKDKIKLAQKLQRKGFRTEIIRRITSEYLSATFFGSKKSG